MPLAVGHGDKQFVDASLNGLFLPVHGSEIEHSGCWHVAVGGLGHGRQNLRR